MAFDGVYNGRQVLDSNGDPVAGARIFFYRHGTVENQTVWSDAALTVPASNPVIADAAGYYDAFMSPSLDYDVVIKSSDESVTYSNEAHSSSTYGGSGSGSGGGSTPADSDYQIVDTVAEVQALTGTDSEDMVELVEPGRSGLFVWSTENESANVTLDTKKVFYIPPDSDPTGASGCWVRRANNNEVIDTWAGTDADSLKGAAVMAAGKKLVITAAWALTAAGAVVAQDNTQIEGRGGSITQTGSGFVGLTVGDNCPIKGLEMTGFGTSSSQTTEDVAILSLGKDNVDIRKCRISGYAGHPVYVSNATDIKIKDNIAFQNIGDNVTTTVEADFYIASNWERIEFTGNRGFTDAANKKDILVFLAAWSTTAEGECSIVKNNFADGYKRGGIATSDEDPTTDAVSALVESNIILNSGQSAIKLKNFRNYVCSKNIIDEFEIDGPEVAGSLQGGIFCNSGGNGVCSENVITTTQANSTNAIKYSGNPNTSSTYLTAPNRRSNFVCADNIVQGTPDHALYISVRCYDLSVSNLQARFCAGYIRASGDATDVGQTEVRNLSITGGSYRGQGYGATDDPKPVRTALQLDYVLKATISNLFIDEATGFGVSMSNCEDLTFIGVTVCDACQNGTQDAAWRIADTDVLTMIGCHALLRDGTTHEYAISWGGTNTRHLYVGCQWASNNLNVVFGTEPGRSRFVGCTGYEGTSRGVTVSGNAITVNFYKKHYTLEVGGQSILNTISGMALGQVIRVGTDYNVTIQHNFSNIRTMSGSSISLTPQGVAGDTYAYFERVGSEIRQVPGGSA